MVPFACIVPGGRGPCRVTCSITAPTCPRRPRSGATGPAASRRAAEKTCQEPEGQSHHGGNGRADGTQSVCDRTEHGVPPS
ncbi:hypothetical protein F750_6204 [Streptomyces sp. PAMC 26508]|nr:hypothetical protein F750_6204 [Streptomyces sp. PAMC 26508]